ncbi:MAG: EAL domain-containing protein [Rhizobiaceae bacterium]
MIRLAVITAIAAFVSLWLQAYSFLTTTEKASAGGFVGNSVLLAACTTFIAISVSYILWRSIQDMRLASRLAFVDDLTGLANRRSFDQRLSEELSRAHRQGTRTGILYLDLDRFKHINDSYGHEAGDAVIREFGKRVQSVLRSGDFVARLSGDEFSTIITSVAGRSDLEYVGRRIFEKMAEPVQFKGKSIYVGASIGGAIAEPGNMSASECLRHADFALLQAKEAGRNNLQVFDPSMAEEIRSRGALENDLRDAILNNRFTIKYQPLISQQENRVLGVEALVRWLHPEHGPISPSIFIPIAEEIGMIERLGELILRQACQDMLDLKPIKLAVNVSVIQFVQRGFVERVQAILDETGFEPERLELEITESVFITDPEKTRTIIGKFRGIGVRIALDDFGTGFSSMSYLRDFPLDRIKIDRSFVSEINSSGRSLNLVSHMIELGKTLGMHVTVEGIETEDQLTLLRKSGCHELQGYLFSKPVDLATLREFCSAHGNEALDQKARLRLVS